MEKRLSVTHRILAKPAAAIGELSIPTEFNGEMLTLSVSMDIASGGDACVPASVVSTSKSSGAPSPVECIVSVVM